ncbi:MAG: hypothetical protein FE046_02475 [Thermoplasmata archaeon]|nr:MAG: hypothetical protein FE046_02475 [Thermoplasmata archaeon]
MSKRKRSEIIDIENVRKSERDYFDSVHIFLTLSELFREHKIDHQIEQDVKKCSGTSVTPDFLLFSEEEITDVVEHKSSLNASYGKEKLREVENKYKCLKANETEYHPEITCLIPIPLLKIIEDIRDKENIKVLLAGFAINHDVEKITFEIHDRLRNNKLEDILNKVISFKHSDYSEYKFIKAEPNYPTYTAFVLWSSILISFYDPYVTKNNYFEVDFNKVSKRALEFFPSWIRNNKQLSNNRVKIGLRFLKKINFIDWEEGKSIIKVYYTKGTRVGDLREYFAKKYVEIHKKKKDHRKQKSGKVLSLDEFF